MKQVGTLLWDSVFISGTGRFLPPRVNVEDVLSDCAISANPTSLKLSDWASLTISRDHSAAEMAGMAAVDAMKNSGCGADDIASLVYACLDDQEHFAPVCHVQRVLGVPEALAFELGAASNGGATGLVVAASLLRSDPSAGAAMVTAAGRYHAGRLGRWQESLGVFLSDGSAAAVLSREGGYARLIASSHTSASELESLVAVRGDLDDGNIMLAQKTSLGPYLPIIRDAGMKTVKQVLEESGVELPEVAKVAVTGVGLAQLSALILEPLDIAPSRTTWDFLRETGHVGPSDALLGIDHLLRGGQLQRGEKILVVGMGIGFRFTTLLLEVCDPPVPK
ncbi:ketoacyl-ACP synthase III family protein [Streptosporangium amethystogenes subsp. fukuiense]|uniref:Ketoacyl-ACP synthase III family protein n=1 Tax=Streptosporangium amethystogenes subsp. fukuiense TaxID=698418 RepID=A0ABW2TAR3_9ACTN